MLAPWQSADKKSDEFWNAEFRQERLIVHGKTIAKNITELVNLVITNATALGGWEKVNEQFCSKIWVPAVGGRWLQAQPSQDTTA